MPRQPFLPTYAGAPWALGAGVIENKRPDFVTMIGRCLVYWPFIEHQMATLLGILLKADTQAAVAVYTTLRMGRTQRDAIEAAAKVVLEPKQLELLQAILSVQRSVEKQRVDLAHGQWGFSDQIQDGVLWVSAKHHAPWQVTMLHKGRNQKQEDFDEFAKRFFIYRENDLQEVYDQMREIWQILFDFISYLRGHPTVSDEELYDRLSNQPRIREALTHLRQHQNSR